MFCSDIETYVSAQRPPRNTGLMHILCYHQQKNRRKSSSSCGALVEISREAEYVKGHLHINRLFYLAIRVNGQPV